VEQALAGPPVNTETGLRTSGDRNDPYAVFRRMLTRGSPPTGIEELIAESKALAFSDESGSR